MKFFKSSLIREHKEFFFFSRESRIFLQAAKDVPHLFIHCPFTEQACHSFFELFSVDWVMLNLVHNLLEE